MRRSTVSASLVRLQAAQRLDEDVSIFKLSSQIVPERITQEMTTVLDHGIGLTCRNGTEVWASRRTVGTKGLGCVLGATFKSSQLHQRFNKQSSVTILQQRRYTAH